jgi:hypothetical protein
MKKEEFELFVDVHRSIEMNRVASLKLMME